MRRDISEKIWVVIPAFNEEESISSVIEDVIKEYENVVVVDDGSTDLTAEVAARTGARVIRHPINLGQGAALQTGITFALERGANYIATFDADGQHKVSDISSLYAAIVEPGVEIALGSRFLGSTVGMTRSRKLLLKAAILFTYLTTGLKLTDAHNGLRLLTNSAAKKINITQNRMAHASELIEVIAKLNIGYVEVPVTIIYSDYSRRKGQRAVDALFVLFDLFIGRVNK